MDIINLIPTQESYRSFESIIRMQQLVKESYVFNKDNLLDTNNNKLISLSECSDGVYVHDGHHRVLSILLGGRQKLDESEYVFTGCNEYSYQEFAPANGWYTPMNIQNEVRSANFMETKKYLITVYRNNGFDINKTRQVSHQLRNPAFKECYWTHRTIRSFGEWL